ISPDPMIVGSQPYRLGVGLRRFFVPAQVVAHRSHVRVGASGWRDLQRLAKGGRRVFQVTLEVIGTAEVVVTTRTLRSQCGNPAIISDGAVNVAVEQPESAAVVVARPVTG